MLADQADHVLGIDTHRDSHSAAILAARRQPCRDR